MDVLMWKLSTNGGFSIAMFNDRRVRLHITANLLQASTNCQDKQPGIRLPSGYVKTAIENGPVNIVSFPNTNGGSFHS